MSLGNYIGKLFGKTSEKPHEGPPPKEVDQPEAEETYEEQLEREIEEYEEVVVALDNANRGLTVSIGLLQKEKEADYRNAMVTIACLLTMAGGEVDLSKEIIDMISSSDIKLDYIPSDKGQILRLSENVQDTSEQNGEAEEDS